jgi:uncharacterized membrane protein YdbT with pleckstrin-like domain
MSYVDSQLLPNETVRYRGHLHKSMYVIPYAFGGVALFTAYRSIAAGILWWAVGFWVLLTAIAYVWCRLIFNASEFAVTTKRVVIKVGMIRRRTLETMLSKVEAIEVDQSVMGRMLNYGTLIVSGTGGTKEAFRRISHPLDFRRQVQAAISSAEDARGYVAAPAGVAARDERPCPHCAEPILKAANVCKHCGRAVDPVQPTT